MALGTALIVASIFIGSKVASAIIERNEQKKREERAKEVEMARLKALVEEKERELQKLKSG